LILWYTSKNNYFNSKSIDDEWTLPVQENKKLQNNFSLKIREVNNDIDLNLKENNLFYNEGEFIPNQKDLEKLERYKSEFSKKNNKKNFSLILEDEEILNKYFHELNQNLKIFSTKYNLKK